MAKRKLADLGVEVGISMKAFDRGMAAIEKRLKALTKPVTVNIMGNAKGVNAAGSTEE